MRKLGIISFVKGGMTYQEAVRNATEAGNEWLSKYGLLTNDSISAHTLYWSQPVDIGKAWLITLTICGLMPNETEMTE